MSVADNYMIDSEKHLIKACKEQRAHIAELEAVLRLAQQKLEIYRAGSAGEYTGGMEYTALIARIDAALRKSTGK